MRRRRQRDAADQPTSSIQRVLQIGEVESEVTREKHEMVAVDPDDRFLVDHLQLLAVAQNLLREEIVDATIGVLIGDDFRRVLLPAELRLRVVVDHGASVQHGRQDRLAVAVVVEMIQLGVEEDGETVHLEETLHGKGEEEVPA